MKTFLRLFTFIFFMGSLSTTHATIYYRHIPFTLSASNLDKVIVDYDFTGHYGITCSSNVNKVVINFVYKGNQKSAVLPVVIENARVPNKNGEELADVDGQFTISPFNEALNGTAFNLSCDYVERDLS